MRKTSNRQIQYNVENYNQMISDDSVIWETSDSLMTKLTVKGLAFSPSCLFETLQLSVNKSFDQETLGLKLRNEVNGSDLLDTTAFFMQCFMAPFVLVRDQICFQVVFFTEHLTQIEEQ